MPDHVHRLAALAVAALLSAAGCETTLYRNLHLAFDGAPCRIELVVDETTRAPSITQRTDSSEERHGDEVHREERVVTRLMIEDEEFLVSDDRILHDGATIATIPPSTQSLRFEVHGGRLTISADGVALHDRRLRG